jgi:hypothetical protein
VLVLPFKRRADHAELGLDLLRPVLGPNPMRALACRQGTSSAWQRHQLDRDRAERPRMVAEAVAIALKEGGCGCG